MSENKKKGGCLKKVLLGILAFVVLMVGIGFLAAPDSAKMPAEFSKIAEQTKTDKAQTEQIKKALDAVGVDEISEIKYDSMYDYKGEKGYRITSHGLNNVILIMKDNAVKEIRYADTKLYTDGKAQANLKDFYFSDEEVNKYGMMAQKAVTNCLKSPNSAKFPTWHKFNYATDKDKNIIVTSYVDAKNAFNAEVRSEWGVKLSKDNAAILQVVIDGKEMYNAAK